MEYCYKCGIPETKVLLFDVVTYDGISKICRKCAYNENIPIIKKHDFPKDEQKTVHERLSAISNIPKKEIKSRELEKEETSLKEMVNRNFRISVGSQGLRSSSDLIRNFHWVVMRARRMKHLTKSQLADAIHEPEIAIRMIERGLVPKSNKFVDKLENFLKISIREHENKKEEFLQEIKSEFMELNDDEVLEDNNLDIDKLKSLTVSDLQEMKKNKEFEVLEEDLDIEKFEELEKEDTSDDWKAL